jgi:DNA-binding NtrC family response regulator
VHPDLDSLALAEVLSLAERVASMPGMPLVVAGEPGAPLEALARYIHDRGPAGGRGHRWLPVRCRGVPDETVQDELGEIMERPHGGTVFIDSVCDLAAVAQVRLLSLLRARAPDGQSLCRVIAATTVDVATAVRDGRLRADLLEKIAATIVAFPPLRARAPDIERLASVYLKESAAFVGKRMDGLSSGAISKLRAYAFPGNERELRRIVGRGVVMEVETTLRGDSIELGQSHATNDEAFASEIAMAAVRERDRPATLAEMERAYIVWVIRYAKGNRTAASRMLGISYPTIAKKISEYGIDLGALGSGWKRGAR